MLSANVYANMRLVIKEAKNNLKNNQIPIAALIVNTLTNEIIAKAANTDSPVGHAELLAINKALELHDTNRLNNFDIYVSIEPCPMCAYAIRKCHFNTLYFGAEDQKGGGIINGTQNNLKSINHVSHIYEKETADLLSSFFRDKRESKV
ncbi:MAG: nucleoside deaminase [Proteobacteria bacterium]|nr:nucleoside deaminase [Pseudomonadota bacterium]